MVLNLDYWRRNDVSKRLLEYFLRNLQNVRYADQDVLNGVLGAEKSNLPYRYNVPSGMLMRSSRYYWEDSVQIEEAVRAPAVVHFSGADKPWQPLCFHPWRDVYMRCRASAGYSGMPRPSSLPPAVCRALEIMRPVLKPFLKRAGIYRTGIPPV